MGSDLVALRRRITRLYIRVRVYQAREVVWSISITRRIISDQPIIGINLKNFPIGRFLNKFQFLLFGSIPGNISFSLDFLLFFPFASHLCFFNYRILLVLLICFSIPQTSGVRCNFFPELFGYALCVCLCTRSFAPKKPLLRNTSYTSYT